VFCDLACQDQRVQCPSCTIPFSSALEAKAWFTASNCKNCELDKELERDLTHALDKLDDAVQSDSDIGPLSDAVMALNKPNSKIHVRYMHLFTVS